MKIRVLLALALLAPVLAHADVVAVVSSRSPIMLASQGQVADIFLGKLARLPDGTPVVPVDQAEGAALRDDFYQRFASKSPAQVRALWSKLIFTGRGRPPRALMSSAEVIKVLRENPYAIGYVDRREVDSSLRILP